jgi:uncharacterized protein YoxC
MDVLKKFAYTKRQLQSIRKELDVCENDIKEVESKLKNTTSFGDIIVKNAKYIQYIENVQIYYSWLKTTCLMTLEKDKGDAKWAWFDFQRKDDIKYYLENEDTLYLKVIDAWEKTNNRKEMSFYKRELITAKNDNLTEWPLAIWYSSRYKESTELITFSLSKYKEELQRCEDELNKMKDLFNSEYDKLNKHNYKHDLSCLMDKQKMLKQSLQDTENTLENIIFEIDSITDDYDELRTNSNLSTLSDI